METTAVNNKAFSLGKKVFGMINQTEYRHLKMFRNAKTKGLKFKALTAEEITLLDFVKNQDVSASLKKLQQILSNPSLTIGTAGVWGKFIQNNLIALIDEVNEKSKPL